MDRESYNSGIEDRARLCDDTERMLRNDEPTAGGTLSNLVADAYKNMSLYLRSLKREGFKPDQFEKATH